MPYKYVVAQLSKSFANAPPVIMRALARLTWAGQECVNNGSFMPFNELLALGYFEKGAIGVCLLTSSCVSFTNSLKYHDDGEVDLGPTIATLSLGCEASMSIRMKATYFYGKTKAGKLLADDPVLPGCFEYEKRKELKELRGTISDVEYQKRRETLFSNIKFKKGANTVEVLNMRLKHGDMVVMHGADIQKYYEVSVSHGCGSTSLLTKFLSILWYQVD
jgi:hypothetical protein